MAQGHKTGHTASASGHASGHGKSDLPEAGGGVPTDGPDGWYRPTESAHYTELGLATPDTLYLCQDASGPLVPTIDGLALGNLTATGTGHLYQQAVTGWTAHFVGLPVGLARWSADLGLSMGESFAVRVTMSIAATAGNQRVFLCTTNNRVQTAASTGTIRTVHGGVVASGAVAHNDLATVRQMVWYRNASANQSGFVSNLEAITGTHDEMAALSSAVGLGTHDITNSVELRCNEFAVYKGANAEQDWSAYLSTLRGL